MTPREETLSVGGVSVHAWVGGEGPPLLYLHSAGGETEWLPFHEQLARHFTVYLPAHPGFADSKGLEQVRDICDYAWHYVDLIQELKLGPVPVVGFSLGGFVAQVLDTGLNWRDTMQMEMPGFRERVCHIRLDADEGGLNLSMQADAVKGLMMRGAYAGESFSAFSFGTMRAAV